MKKRLTSVLLTIVMVASLFSGLGVTAFADVETIEYTLKSGDNVYTVCRKLGIDFYANYDWITNTNKIKNYSSLGVGKKIILPLGDTTVVTPPAATTPPTTTVTTPAKNNVNLLTGDTVASYLVPYVVSSGDTLYDICLREGLNYKDTVDTIKKVNGLKNENRIQVGRTLLLPSATMPASGSCVAIVSHKIVSGDATYNLCGSYNIDYEDNLELMKALNGKSNMSVIKTGQNLLIPVPTTITPSSTTTTPGTSTGGTTGGTTNDKDDDKTEEKPADPTPTPAPVSYKITKNSTNTQHGSYSVLVNNSTSSDSAKKGDTVTVNVKPNKAYALDYVKVVDKNGNSVALNETTFTMPESDVTISVVFVAARQYKITSDYATNGTYVVTVNGVETTYASEGQTVKITPTPVYNYEYAKAHYTKSAEEDGKSTTIVDKQFVMPAHDVTVYVNFRQATPHELTTPGSANGSYKVQLNGTTVNKAKAGEVLQVVTTPNDGYELNKITVTPTKDTIKDTVTVNADGSFIMPEFDATLKVTFKAQDFNIKSAATTNGTFTVLDGSGKEISSADTAKGIYVKAAPAAGYVVDKVTYTDYNGKVTEVSLNGDYYYFTMPASDVTVNVTFKARVFYLSAHADSPAATFTVGGKETTRAYMGETVTVNGNPAAGVKVKEIKAYNTSNREIPMTTSNTLVMPAGNVCFKVTYELMDLSLKLEAKNGTATFEVGGVATSTAKLGQTVTVKPAAASGYDFSNIVVTDANGKNVGVDQATGCFAMPGTDVKIVVNFVAKPTPTPAPSTGSGSGDGVPDYENSPDAG